MSALSRANARWVTICHQLVADVRPPVDRRATRDQQSTGPRGLGIASFEGNSW